MRTIATELLRRGKIHDSSKLEDPEKQYFDQVGGRLSKLTYGTDRYRKSLKELKPALDHHYANNSHHPEHYSNGIDGMDLFDIVEMFCDWKAASERHDDGNFGQSLHVNKMRFNISNQLQNIFENTRRRLKW